MTLSCSPPDSAKTTRACARSCAPTMDFFGIKLNDEVNDRTLRQSNIVKISADDSRVPVYVIPTDEELVIARDTEDIVNSIKK